MSTRYDYYFGIVMLNITSLIIATVLKVLTACKSWQIIDVKSHSFLHYSENNRFSVQSWNLFNS